MRRKMFDELIHARISKHIEGRAASCKIEVPLKNVSWVSWGVELSIEWKVKYLFDQEIFS